MLRCPLLILALVALAATPLSAGAADDDMDRWLPGFSLEGGVNTFNADATITSPQRGRFEGDTRKLFGYIGAAVHVSTPVLVEKYGKPRLFARFGASTSFDGKEQIAEEGAPGPINVPIDDRNGDGIPDGPAPVASVEGVGSATGSKTQPLALTAGIGLDFTIEKLDRTIHIKPSIEWMYQEDKITGIVGFAETVNTDPTQQSFCPCRTALARGENTEGFHSIGPGIEVEIEASRFGPFLVGVYAASQVYFLFDRDISVRGSAVYSDNSSSVSFRSTYERDVWDVRAGAGLRLHFAPE